MSRLHPCAFCYGASRSSQTAVELALPKPGSPPPSNDDNSSRGTGPFIQNHGVLSWSFVRALEEIHYDGSHTALLAHIQENLRYVQRDYLQAMDQTVLFTFTRPAADPNMKVLQQIYVPDHVKLDSIRDSRVIPPLQMRPIGTIISDQTTIGVSDGRSSKMSDISENVTRGVQLQSSEAISHNRLSRSSIVRFLSNTVTSSIIPQTSRSYFTESRLSQCFDEKESVPSMEPTSSSSREPSEKGFIPKTNRIHGDKRPKKVEVISADSTMPPTPSVGSHSPPEHVVYRNHRLPTNHIPEDFDDIAYEGASDGRAVSPMRGDIPNTFLPNTFQPDSYPYSGPTLFSNIVPPLYPQGSNPPGPGLFGAFVTPSSSFVIGAPVAPVHGLNVPVIDTIAPSFVPPPVGVPFQGLNGPHTDNIPASGLANPHSSHPYGSTDSMSSGLQRSSLGSGGFGSLPPCVPPQPFLQGPLHERGGAAERSQKQSTDNMRGSYRYDLSRIQT